MRKTYINKIALCLISVITLCLGACSDWTEIESVDINQPSISETNPALYEEYLQNLRDYKSSVHKCLIVEFDNSEKQPFSRSQHINVVPDSVDYISLKYPANLSEWELNEIDSCRMNKGTKFLFTIRFDAIKLQYEQKVIEREAIVDALEEGEEEPMELPSFFSYMVDSLNTTIGLVNEYEYDGICFGYKGKSIRHMTEKELVEYSGYHNAFIGILKDWKSRNTGKELLFEGKPQNLLDKTFLEDCKHIIIPCNTVGNASKIDYNLFLANVDGVPNNRFVVSVETTSLDETDIKTGYWADGSIAINGAAQWVASEHQGFQSSGLSILNVANDYFSEERLYNHTRSAINIMNPSLKN
ncbi:glycoside hydrolase family 18 [Marinifilum sp.]|uniref:glycoside hydrolase family 18 n=1 Tax=Marinifilum sp. TaxID=2033137 RepID=UPI003BAD573F